MQSLIAVGQTVRAYVSTGKLCLSRSLEVIGTDTDGCGVSMNSY